MSEFNNPTPWVPGMDEAKQTQRQSWYMRKNIMIAVIVAVALMLLAIGSAGTYALVRNAKISDQIVADSEKLDEGYQKLLDKYHDQRDETIKMNDELSEANDIITEADLLKDGISDLEKQHDDAQTQVDTLNAQLETLTGKVEQAKKNSISDGVWQVGTDIDPGTYRATESVAEDCYWAIEQGDNIVDNDIPGGGYPQTTVSAGQQLKLSNCGTWSKQ